MRRVAPSALALVAVCLLSSMSPGPAVGQGRDPAGRGLDAFLHLPDAAAPRATLPVQVEVVGFPTVTEAVPLPGASIEAAWDPEHLGPGVSAAPPPVRAVADATGRAHLDVPVPDGDQRELKLLVGLRSGAHQRTRTVTVTRVMPHDVTLHVGDPRVVPGGAVSAWILVTSAQSGAPAASTPIEVSLLEGGVARFTVQRTTDAAGTTMVRVPIPRIEEPAWKWELRARTLVEGRPSGAAALRLTPREETPASPRMWATWQVDSVRAGERAKWVVRVRDASDQPIAALPVRTWIGPRGTEPPKDAEKWAKASTAVRTDALGEVEGGVDAPRTVPTSGTTLQLVARTTVEGRDLEATHTVTVGAPASLARLDPEGGSVVPGVTQRMLLSVRDGKDAPVAAAFSVDGDGLAARVTTDARGLAEVTWNAPRELGAHRDAGPCAGGVAAAVTVRAQGEVPALGGRRAPFELCVPVNRDATALVVPETSLVRAGDKMRVRVLAGGVEPLDPRARAARNAKPGPWSVLLRTPDGGQAASGWIEDGARGGEVNVPAGAVGVASVAAVGPLPATKARLAGGAVLVAPRVLPKLTAKIAGGRAAPGGKVIVEAELSDGKGTGLPGTVAAVVVDLRGGGSVAGLRRLDTRGRLCHLAGAPMDLCDPFVEGEAALEPMRRGLLGKLGTAAAPPTSDPGGEAKARMREAFAQVVRSLEGAVFESTASADRLRDARRRAGGGWAFNPELMTLATSAFEQPPTTPGGEPLTLADLVAVDPQVTFDHVARRVTRLKIFQVLAAVRAFRHENKLDGDEPAMRDPNAIVRRLVREQRLPEQALLDPWGGTLQFVKSAGAPMPFLTPVRGFELHAPGPDGALGTGDDVKDPFERVLRAATPYARAVEEDRLVDARFELEVGDATVSAWGELLERLTGTSLGGRGEGIGLGSIGTVGHGSGTGTGQGFGSGRGRLGASITTGVAFWSAPVRTDARGRVRIEVPLGDIETTWGIGLVGVPDHAGPATTTIDVPVALPLSVRVDAGARWVEGDELAVAVTLRNRTPRIARTALSFTASGVAALSDPRKTTAQIDVPAGGSATTTVRVRAPRVGRAVLDVKARAAGVPEDAMRHTWEVVAAGERMTLASARWVDDEQKFDLAADPNMRPLGAPRLVLERGQSAALGAALDAMDPDALGSPDALADAIEVAGRIERWATTRSGQTDPTSVRARQVARRAIGRLAALGAEGAGQRWAALARAIAWAPPSLVAQLPKPQACPPSDVPTLEVGLAGLEAEPPPTSGSVPACWDAFVSSTLTQVSRSGDPLALARAALALAERPHRAAALVPLVERLREVSRLYPGGGVALPPKLASSRAARATIHAALLRTVGIGKPSPAPASRLTGWVIVQRDVQGGYGSPAATRAVVRALLSAAPASKGMAKVTVSGNGPTRTVDVGPNAIRDVALSPTGEITVSSEGAGLVARVERPVLRPWARPPEPSGPVHLEVTWPTRPRAGATGTLTIGVRHDTGRPNVIDVRIPLPPGVALAAPAEGVRQIQGVLSARVTADASTQATTLQVPLRFTLAGRVTVPEAKAALAHEQAADAIAAARPLRID